MPSSLKFLHFDLSHDADGGMGVDASASVTAAHWPALQAEVAGLLAWLAATFPGGQGPVEEGGEWDYDLHGSEEASVPVRLAWLPEAGRLLAEPSGAPLRRHTLHLSLHGGPAFAQAMAAQLGAALGQGDEADAEPARRPAGWGRR